MAERLGGVRKGRLALVVLAVLLVAGLLWGVAAALAESASPTVGKVTLRVGWTSRPDNLNPFLGQESTSYEIYHLNYDLLFGFAQDLSPTPELAAELPTAENGGFSADGMTVTVKLRQNVTWQDGQPFIANDVAFTYNYIIENDMGAYTAMTTYVKDVQVIDDHTVQFNLTQPKANFLRMWVPILPEHIWSAIPAKLAGGTYPNKPPVIGTGPFQVVSTKNSNATVVMKANPTYWRGKPAVDEVVLQSYENPDNMAADLRAGALDVAWGIPTAQFSQLKQDPKLTAIAYEYNGFEELGFNCYTGKTSLGNPVLKDWRFRQALNYAVDHDAIVSTSFLGNALPATTIIPSDYYPKSLDWHWEPPADVKYTFDLAKAKAALDAAGYKDTNGDGLRDYQGKPIELRLWARNAAPTSQRDGRLLAGWFQSIGLKIKYSIVDDGLLLDKMYNTNAAGEFAPDYDMFIWRNGGDVDPTYIVSCFITDQINDWSDCAYSNPTYDALFEKQASQIDQQQRRQTIVEMQKILYHDSPYIPLVYPFELEAYNTKDWTGWVRSPASKGGVIYNYNNIESYILAHPKTAAVSTGGGSNTGLIVGIVVAAVGVVGIVVWLLRRGRGRAIEE
jgi:peptide/nickel transport system substrate-binding protein